MILMVLYSRVIVIKSGDKDDDSDGTLFQRYSSTTQCLQDGSCITSVPFIYKAN